MYIVEVLRKMTFLRYYREGMEKENLSMIGDSPRLV